MMPKQSGIALYRKFKSDDRSKDIPAIFISAFGMEDKFAGGGFRQYFPEPEVPEPIAYLEKPVEVPRLLQLIQEVVG